MKKMLYIMLTVGMILSILSGCREAQPDSQVAKTISLTIAETMQSCVAFEYAEPGKPYCFYAYDEEGNSYRVLWTNFTGLNEKDQIIVEYDEDIKALSYDEYPSGWTPQYEVTATNVRMEKRANEKIRG